MMLTARETSAIFHESCVRQAMTKRSNPFADYVPRQIKTCVTPDLIATEEEKRAVCEKTLSLMREASKHVYHAESESVSCCSRAPGKQLTLQQMMQGGGAGCKGKGKERQKRNACCSCRSPCDNSEGLCSHCSKAVCTSCTQLCQRCKETFCPLCSVVNYEENQVRHFCFSCL